MAPWRASTTKSEWLPDDPTAFAPSRLWKLLCITIWGDSRNQNLPTDSAEEGQLRPSHFGGRTPHRRLSIRGNCSAGGFPPDFRHTAATEGDLHSRRLRTM